ncbi:MAG TPA: PAS domain-containing sensor histidine kinase [Opitutaceae bacterium]|nr:PAS domain-containing sensor histidine kinase [Opitutaceae bacterium]
MNAPPMPAPIEEERPPALDALILHALVENFPDSLYFKDRESRFIAVSRSKAVRHGATCEELVGKSDIDFFTAEHAQWARVEEEDIMSTGEPCIGRLVRVNWPDGRQTWAVSSKMPLHDETGATVGTWGITTDVTQEQELQLELEKTKRHLVDASRTAGMAEVATGVLHNVGNVLTSLNVSASVIATSLYQSKAESLAKLSALLTEHASDLGEFVTRDPKGRRVADFLESLARHSIEERDHLLEEIDSLQQNIDHIKEIVTMQQAYATMIGVVEPLDATTLMEDSLRMNAGALVRHDVAVVREFNPVPPVIGEKAKVLQILVNLIRNAKYACDESGAADKCVTLRVEAAVSPGAEATAQAAGAPAVPDRVRLVVQDNGIGIPPENLPRIFEHGFTTRASGHGFGLHSAASVAKELKGTLSVHSAGHRQGATFTLELPVAPTE